MSVDNFSFQADIKELMNLIIHSFYSSRDIFLRELLSNSSDAIEKQKYKDLRVGKLKEEYKIKVSYHKDNRVIMIMDNGVGMTREELKRNLSTIAKSGTKEFIRRYREKKDDQIGQFGVGFFSSFLVSDNVCVWTKTEKCEKWNQWESMGIEEYSITELDNFQSDELKENGTILLLSVKDDALEYLEKDKIRSIIEKHCNFITHPIYLQVEREGRVGEDMIEWERMNGEEALWYRESRTLEYKDYNNFYKIIKDPYGDCLYYKHFKTEGSYEFRGILYIPSSVPFNYLNVQSREFREIKLYVKKVLVLDKLDKTMLPDWLNFICGVIDCPDLPMTVSREMLQESKMIRILRNQLKKQAIQMIMDLQEDKEKYTIFYKYFQKNIKLGLHEGDEKLLSFLRFNFFGEEGDDWSFERYVLERLREGQKKIYYICNNEIPILYAYKRKGYSVIHFKDSIDEFMMQRVLKYKEYEFVNIGKEHELPWRSELEEEDEFCNYLLGKLKEENVERIKMSDIYLEKDIGCIVSSKFGMTGNMENLMKSQPLGGGGNIIKGQQRLELNYNHPIVNNLRKYYKGGKEDENVEKLIKIIYQCCLLNSGFKIERPNEFSKQIIELLSL